MAISKIVQDSVNSGVAGTGPAFSAWQSSAQSISANTWTKLQFQTKEFDTASAFDSVTNSRFQPTVAGYYQVNGAFYPGGVTTAILGIYKNGSQFKQGSYFVATVIISQTFSSLVYLNGSTDYIELYGYSSSAVTIGNYQSTTYFQASMVRSA